MANNVASLSEMMRWADWEGQQKQNASGLVNLINKAGEGFKTGIEKGIERKKEAEKKKKEAEEKRIADIKTSMDVAAKIATLQEEAHDMVAINDTLKALGLKQLDENEINAFRGTAFNSVGSKQPTNMEPVPKDTLGKMVDKYGDLNLDEVSFKQGGKNYKYRRSDKDSSGPKPTASSEITKKNAILKMANQLAVAETISELKAGGADEMDISMYASGAKMAPTEKLLKWQPAAEAYFNNDMDEYKRLTTPKPEPEPIAPVEPEKKKKGFGGLLGLLKFAIPGQGSLAKPEEKKPIEKPKQDFFGIK